MMVHIVFGSSVFDYRLRKLIKAGIFESKGNLKAVRFYSVRLRR